MVLNIDNIYSNIFIEKQIWELKSATFAQLMYTLVMVLHSLEMILK